MCWKRRRIVTGRTAHRPDRHQSPEVRLGGAMEPIDDGGSSAAAAMRAAEEARRRAAEEAQRAEAARRAAEEAARLRLIERNQMDTYEATPPASVFSSASATVTPVPPASPTFSPDEAARLAADP